MVKRRRDRPRTIATLGCEIAVLAGLSLLFPSAAHAASVRADITYAQHRGTELHLDAYLPAGDGPFPAMIVVPGGWWTIVNRAAHAAVPQYLADHGIAAFVVDYRSALVSPYPAAVEDVTSAITWVREHADEFHVAPAELGAMGFSAGGQLVALAGSTGTGPLDRGARVRLVVSWSGPMDLRSLLDSGPARIDDAVRTFLGCSASAACARETSEASPITHVDSSDPPMILVNGGSELIPAEQPQAMAQALTQEGIDNRILILKGGRGLGRGASVTVLDQIIPYIQAWIAGQEAPADLRGAPGSSGSGNGDKKEDRSPVPSTAAPSGSAATGSVGSGGGGSAGIVLASVAMAAAILVVVELVVIARLRRRIAELSAGATVGSPGSASGVS